MTHERAAIVAEPDAEPLSSSERSVWLSTLAFTSLLPYHLDQELKESHNLTLFDYHILAILGDAPNRSLLMADLAAHTNTYPSRLSHAVNRLQSRNLVVRYPHPNDRRAVYAYLTDRGQEALAAAEPSHVRSARRYVFDMLDQEEQQDLQGILDKVITALTRGERRPFPEDLGKE